MEQQPHKPNGGDQHPEVNSYGIDDPEEQAKIEQARIDAHHGRQRDRARLERSVEGGLRPDDAEALIEFEHYVEDQRRQITQTERATELAVAATERETVPPTHPRVYVVDLASAERGIEHGSWIDATQPADELDADIAAMLDSSPTIGAQEWAVEATEGFTGLDLHGFTDTTLIAQLGQGVAEHGAAYAVYVQIVGTSDRDQLDKFEDVYVGSFASPEAWARNVGEDLEWDAHLDEVVDPMLRPYLSIDYARFAQESRASWDVFEGVDGKTHVFMR
jgi:antirestriction protein